MGGDPYEVATILVVLGDEAGRCAARDALRQGGFAPVERSRGEDAVDLARTPPQPSLVILGMVLPDLDGLEVCRRLKADASTADIPVILVAAAMPDEERRIEGLECGAAAWLRYPINARELQALARALTGARRNVETRSTDKERPHAPADASAAGSSRDIVDRRQAELERERLARQRQLALDAANLGWWHYDPITKIATYDARYREIFGVSGTQRPNEEILTLLHPDDLPRVWAAVEAALNPADPRPYSVEYRINLPDGSTKRIEAHGIASFEGVGESRQATSFVGTVADITERTKAQEALRRSEEHFRDLAEALPQIVWTADAAGAVEWLNRRWYEYTGLPESAGSGWTWKDVTHPDDMERTVCNWTDACRSGTMYQNEVRVRDRHGAYRWFLVRAWPVRDAEGNIVRWFGTNTDIHDMKTAEAALLRSREDMDRAQEVGQIGSWRLDVLRNVLTWSDQNYRIFGLPQGTPLTYETFLGCVHPDDRAYVDTRWRAGLAGEPYDIEHRVVAGGQVKWVREKAYLEFDRDGRLLGGFGITHDITVRKQTEEALRKANESLAEADRRKDEFLAMLAHELRNPLAPVRYAVYLLNTLEQSSPMLVRLRTIIERQVDHMARLLDDLLDVSRITRGKITLQKTAVRLADSVSQAAEAARPLAEKRGHTLAVTLPPADLCISADPARLLQVLSNLLGNAIKYTEEGGRISLAATCQDGEAVIRVRDTGIGIAPDVLPRIFDLFVQADTSLARAHGGLGIGLTMVKRLAEMHGGRVEAHSAGLGRGSEFTVYLPALVQEQPVVAVPAAPPQHTAQAALRVMVVDDVADSVQSLSTLLEGWGHEVRTACDGPSALEAARTFRPHVVLLDIGMPGMDGYETARRLRAEHGRAGMLLVVMTGYAQAQDRQRAEDAGFDRHLTKPVDLAVLRELLSKVRPTAP